MKNFIPANDYLNLKKQAIALNIILNTKEIALMQLTQAYNDLVNEISLCRMNEVDSLRNENERLTNLIEKYENKRTNNGI